MDDRSIKVLIVEDSNSTAMALSRALASFNIVGIARDGQSALRMNSRLQPNVITMDIQLPDTDGLDVTRQILSRRKVPIIIVSALVSPQRQGLIFEALRAGAYDVVPKSRFFTADGKMRKDHKLVRLVRVAAMRVVQPEPLPGVPSLQPEYKIRRLGRRHGILTIGASTGGPAALHKLLSALASDFPLPILVAQHMAEGFIEGFVHWLGSQTSLEVRIAVHGESPRSSVAYFPPSAHNLMVASDGKLNVKPFTGSGPCPSVDQLFSSAAKAFGAQTICLLLTGMGSDGAEGMLKAKGYNALTAAQDKESSVVFGMPQVAHQIGAASHVLSLSQIPDWLILHAARKK